MEYYCEDCKKKYKSYKSLWKHNHIYHKQQISINTAYDKQNDKQNDKHYEENKYKCNFCNNYYKHFQSRWRHEKTCKENKKLEINVSNLEINEMKDKMVKYEDKIDKQTNDIIELKQMLQKALKIHPKTLNKINNNGGIVNNGTMNVQIVQLGYEDLHEVLTTKQKIAILNRQAMSINDLVELINTSPEYKQYRNVCITNLQSSFGFKYCNKAKKFIAVNKNELLDDLIDNRIYDIEKFYKEIESKMAPERAVQIKRFIDKILKQPELKNLKKEEIKLILYNNKDKINMESHEIEI